MPRDDVLSARCLQGAANYLSGLAAEDAAARLYEASGYHPVEVRWRGRAGEVDLIFKNEALYVFVEVKAAATCDLAAERLTEAQLARVALAAEEYMGNHAEAGAGHIRIDAALVDGAGKVQIIENITLA